MGMRPYYVMQINHDTGGVYQRIARSTGINALLHSLKPQFNNSRTVYIKHLPTHCLIKTVIRGALSSRDITQFTPPLQPGDKVKVINDRCGHSYPIGSILTIHSICQDVSNVYYMEEGRSVVVRDEIIPAFGYFPTEEDLAAWR